MSGLIDLTGQQFGEWTVLSRSDLKNTAGKRYKWNCRCSCGTLRAVPGPDLKGGRSTKCSPSKGLHPGPVPLTQAHRTTWNSWVGMKQRCLYPGHPEFHRYGGRGITLPDEWRDSFEAFLRDLGPKPAGTSIDRIDLDGPYSKENCRWATRAEQMSNTSLSVRVEHEGESLTLKQLADKLELPYDQLHNYYRDRGYPLDVAIERTRNRRRRTHKRLEAMRAANGTA